MLMDSIQVLRSFRKKFEDHIVAGEISDLDLHHYATSTSGIRFCFSHNLCTFWRQANLVFLLGPKSEAADGCVLVQPDLEKRSRRVSDQGIGTLVQVDSIVRVAVARATRVPLLCSGEKAAGSAPGWTGGGTARGRRRRALDAWPGSTGLGRYRSGRT